MRRPLSTRIHLLAPILCLGIAACTDPATGDVANAEHHKPCDPKNAIVFAATLDGQANTDLYLVAPHHRKPTRLTYSDAPISFPAWSPDHTRIAFVRNLQLFVLDVATGDEQRVADKVGRPYPDPFPPVISGAAWSPDGTQLVYPYPRDPDFVDNGGEIVDESYRTTLHIVNADGTNDVAYQEPSHTNPPGVGTILEPAWASTNVLAFSVADDCSDCAGGPNVYAMSNVDGSNYQVVPYISIDTSPQYDVDWSPDATRWVYTTGPGLNFEEPGSITTASVANPGHTQVLATKGWYPRYSADGTSIAFLRTDGVYVMNADGSEPLRLAKATGVRGLDW